MERVAAEAGGRLWFQLSMWHEREMSLELVEQLQRQVDGYPHGEAVLEMGGRGVEPQVTMATELGLRAFYDFYRKKLGL